MESTTTAPRITDKAIIDYFKTRNGLTVKADRIARLIPSWNKLHPNNQLPNTTEGATALRYILTDEYQQDQQSILANVSPVKSKLTKQQQDILNKQAEEEAQRLIIQQQQTDLTNRLNQLIQSPIDDVLRLTFDDINNLFNYSIGDFVAELLDLNPGVDAPNGRIIILSFYSPNDPNKREQIFLLTRQGVANLRQFIRGDTQYSQDSNAQVMEIFQRFNEGYSLTIENTKILKRVQKVAKEGEYFKHLHTTNIDLSKCAIYNEVQHQNILEEGIETYSYDLLVNRGCLYFALYTHLSMAEDVPYNVTNLNSAFANVTRTSLKLSTVEMVANELEICIKLRYNDGLKNRTVEIGRKGRITDRPRYDVNMGLLGDHYFLDYPINYTMYSIVNYHQLVGVKDFENVFAMCNKKPKRDNTGKRYITTYDLVLALLELKDTHLVDMPNIIEPVNSNGEDRQAEALQLTQADLETAVAKLTSHVLPHHHGHPYDYNADLEQRKQNLNKRMEKDKILGDDCVYVACDLETQTDPVTFKIKPINSNYKLPGQKAKCFIGYDCVLQLLKSLPNNAVLYFHNTKFDITHFQEHFTRVESYVENGGRFIFEKASFYKKNFIIIDTMNYLGGSLKSLAEDFKLPIGKELINYQLYNQVDKRVLDCGVWYRSVDEDHTAYYNNDPQFLANIDKWGLRNKKGQYDAMAYLSNYSKLDVEILEQIFDILVKSLIDSVGVDIRFGEANGYKLYPTISSVCREVSKKYNCMDGVVSNIGIIREFIDGALVGGRTMLQNNGYVNRGSGWLKECILDEKPQVCIDANSLYPSAMVRLGKYAIGKPSILRDLETVGDNYYVVKIRVLKIGKKVDYPILSKIVRELKIDELDPDNKKKKIMNNRHFTNHFDVGEEIIVDKYTLEDAVTFQQLEYDVCFGLVWMDGFNTEIRGLVEMLYEKRLFYKSVGNTALQTSYKLILNSLYGWLAEKPHSSKLNIIKEDDVMRYVLSHSKRVSVASRIGGSSNYLVKSADDITKHENYNHLAVGILSYSKRIMNKVFDVAFDNNIVVNYTDTDSLFLRGEDLDKLEQFYEAKYACKLYDNKLLGLFKIDMDGITYQEDGKLKSGKDCGKLVSVVGGAGRYLGKKTYLLEVQATTVDGRVINGSIISCKGITDTSLNYYCVQNGITLTEAFERMRLGEYLNIDLIEGGGKYRVSYVNTQSFQNKNFSRTIGGFDL